MRITLCYSMQFADKAEDVRLTLGYLGHTAFTTKCNHKYLGLSDQEKEKLKLEEKYNHDAIREHGGLIKESDAILVINYDKHGIAGYIGGNVFLEMGLAHFLDKKIYLLNPIPKMPYYETEIIAMRPVVIGGDLEKILA